jgi:serine phosphatase RsbU (regulator of sigma subunit)
VAAAGVYRNVQKVVIVGLAIDIGIAKVNKYASRESGDTAEVVERPGGGFSIVVVDGQGSGTGAKALSLMLTAKAVSLVKEGVRDGAVARAVHDSLLAHRGGKVSAALDILSADLKHGGVVITRNGTSPYILIQDGVVSAIPAEQGPIGIYPFTRPGVHRYPFVAGLQIWTVTDGIAGAGKRWNSDAFPVRDHVERLAAGGGSAKDLATSLLTLAMSADRDRPLDDMTVSILRVTEDKSPQPIRSLHLVIPLPK